MEDLACENCTIKFHSQNNKPIALPCGDTFCIKCLKQTWEKMAYIKCFKCHKKHFQNFEQFPINFYVSKMISEKEKLEKNTKSSRFDPYKLSSRKYIKDLKNNTIDVNSKISKQVTLSIYSDNKNEKDLIKEREHVRKNSNVCTENSSLDGTGIRRNKNEEGTILFVYLDVLKSIITYFDDKLNYTSNKFYCESIIRSILKATIIFFVTILNYFLISRQMFFRFYMFIILAHNTRKCLNNRNIQHVITCTKRWFCFISIIMMDEFLRYLGVLQISTLKNIWICFVTICTLLVVGPPQFLHLVVINIFRFLKGVNLILENK